MHAGHGPTAEDLVREVRLVLNAGTRVATIARCITSLVGLRALCVPEDPDLGVRDPYHIALAVHTAVQNAVDELGDGPYGQAAQHLFGLSDQARGLTLSRRRGLAADSLDVQPPTIRRWWQDRIVWDVAMTMFRNGRDVGGAHGVHR